MAKRWRYTQGLHDLGNRTYAYLQPDGSWGWSNAGLVATDEGALLVDTLFDVTLTRAMLAEMRAKVPAARNIGTLVNTHANPDHTFGNELVAGAEIVATRACAEEMADLPPAALAELMRRAPGLGETGQFLLEAFGAFDFEGVTLTLPSRTFEGELTLTVGGREVRLLEVGPAHTRGDLLVFLPEDRTVFTGDILFTSGHPVMWAGPVQNWIDACDRILAWAPETVVPGHGPITDLAGVEALKGYFEYLRAEAAARFAAGLSFEEAARDIALDAYADLGEPERVVTNVAALYRELGADVGPMDVLTQLGLMARFRKGKGAR